MKNHYKKMKDIFGVILLIIVIFSVFIIYLDASDSPLAKKLLNSIASFISVPI